MEKRDLEKQTVLVVDDVPENIDVLNGILKDDYRVKVAINGEAGLKIARSADPPDLILLDIMMPGIDGYEVCRRLKSAPETQKIPVIFVTAKEEIIDETLGFSTGAVDYISKPVSPPILKARVRTHLALYDQNQVLEDMVRKRTGQLKNALEKIKTASLDTIHRLTNAAEYRDEDTGAHIKRMSNYSAVIASRLGLNEKTIERLLYASPMHDIGKIGIPDRILLKQGRLDDDEWEIMKRHTLIGARILSGSDAEFIHLGEMIAMTHHEKWDGSGYPRGLSGKEIPLISRIVAIADVFDAFISERPYKKAFSLEKSFHLIRKGKGSHFDPDVVDAFFSVQDNIIAIKNKYKDRKPR